MRPRPVPVQILSAVAAAEDGSPEYAFWFTSPMVWTVETLNETIDAELAERNNTFESTLCPA